MEAGEEKTPCTSTNSRLDYTNCNASSFVGCYREQDPPEAGDLAADKEGSWDNDDGSVLKETLVESDGPMQSKHSTCFSSYREEDPIEVGDLAPNKKGSSDNDDESVRKETLVEGDGPMPSKHATCFIHYRTWIQKHKQQIEELCIPMSEKHFEEQHILMFLGKEKKERTGLAIGVSRMKTGEKALLYVPWKLGFGEEGSFSFPSVPGKTNLTYEVELLDIDENTEGRTLSDMTADERIDAAGRIKKDGNEFFRTSNFQRAVQKYAMAIAFLGDDFMFQLLGKYHEMALAVKIPLHLNKAECFIKLQSYNEVIEECTIVLNEKADNVKARYRRGRARAELGQIDAAGEDLHEALKHAPGDRAIARELRLLDEYKKERYRREKRMYKGILGPFPCPTTPATKVTFLTRIWAWIISIFGYVFKDKKL